MAHTHTHTSCRLTHVRVFVTHSFSPPPSPSLSPCRCAQVANGNIHALRSFGAFALFHLKNFKAHSGARPSRVMPALLTTNTFWPRTWHKAQAIQAAFPFPLSLPCSCVSVFIHVHCFWSYLSFKRKNKERERERKLLKNTTKFEKSCPKSVLYREIIDI